MNQEHQLPKITVLMAVYNGELYLRETIDSILNQTYEDFEFLIINDGSTDSTEEIIRTYSDTRIRLVNNEVNLGLPKSLNRGLKIAQGEFIARQDADDISEPERLEKQFSFLAGNPEIALTGTWFRETDESGENVIRNTAPPCDTNNIRWDILFYTPLVHTMWRKQLILSEVGLYDESYAYAEDWELFSRVVIVNCMPVENVGEYLVSYRMHSKSMSSNSDDLGGAYYCMLIRTKNIGHLLKWDLSGDIHDYERRTQNLVHLYFQGGKDLSSDHTDGAITDLINLSEAYMQKFKLSDEEKKSHLIKIYYKIANANVEKRRIKRTLSYLNKVCRLDSSLLLSKKTAWIFIKLILAPSLMRKIKRYCESKLVFLPSSIRNKFSRTLTDLENL